MSFVLTQSTSVVGLGITASFLGVGSANTPFTYSVLSEPGQAGGTIDSVTGTYTAPTGNTGIDIVQVEDSLSFTATATIKVMTQLELFCDIIQNQMSLADGRVYLWDQKINQPKDNGLYIAVSTLACKPFGNTVKYQSVSGLTAVQSVNMCATLGLDIISRGPEARERKEEVIMALISDYSQYQQEANSFYVAPISKSFVNLSKVDGAAIPYRFHIDVDIQYFVIKHVPVQYFDNFTNPPTVETEA